MNNKELGTEWEQEFVEILVKNGYWAHFIIPNRSGGQPFDVIAVKGGKAFAIDCKTSSISSFSISRLEENQILAFELWIKRGNRMPLIAIKHKEKVYIVPYIDLKTHERVKLTDQYCVNVDEVIL